MHARDAKLALVVDALSPLVPGEVLDNVSTTISAITTGALSSFPVMIVVPGTEEPTGGAQGTAAGPPIIRRRLPIDVIVIAERRAKLSEALAAAEAAIPWDAGPFDLGSTRHADHHAGNRTVYLATLQVSVKYQTGLGQADA